jgi:serine/threonine protein kinase
MRVCDQKVIRRDTHPELVATHEDLDYAMVMPWIEGQTWFDFLQKKERTTLNQSRLLAESTAWVLYALEMNHLAHCDLSSGNVIIDPGVTDVHLVDVEDLYSPWLTPPPMVPAGTPGYQHHEVGESGQWRPTGDRFSGAVLMAEMLAWAHPEVREKAHGESYFAPDELQSSNERYETLLDVLEIYEPGFAAAFEEAWWSEALEHCPPLKTWYDLMDVLPREPVENWAPIDPTEFEGETAVPDNVAIPVAQQAAKNRASVRAQAPQPQMPAFQPVQAAAAPQQKNRRGCRLLAMLFGTIGILACCGVGFAAVWSAVMLN